MLQNEFHIVFLIFIIKNELKEIAWVMWKKLDLKRSEPSDLDCHCRSLVQNGNNHQNGIDH